MSPLPIYMDYNATTPIDRRVADAIVPYLFEYFGNPSSSHHYGVTAKKAIEQARQSLAQLLNCTPQEIIFTSGGTESNNTVIKGVARLLKDKGNHIITSVIEHPAIIEPCEFLAEDGYSITYVGVDQYGRVDPKEIEAAIRPETILISIMHANNEVGTIQPIAEISEIAKEHNVLFHTDAAQSVSKIPVNVEALGVDFLSVAGHKLYAPKGVGALFVRQGLRLPPLLHGAGHESGRRAGTENLPEIVGLGMAARLAREELEHEMKRLTRLRDRLWNGLKTAFVEDIQLNGHPTERLPNTLSVGFKGREAHLILEKIEKELAVSAGSACHAGRTELSSVLKAMKVDPEFARGTLRISVGRFSTIGHIDKAISILSLALR